MGRTDPEHQFAGDREGVAGRISDQSTRAKLSIRALADDLMALIFELFTRPAFLKLLDTGQDWSVKREEFRSAMVQRVSRTLTIHSPHLSKKSAADIALVVLLNLKTVAVHQVFFDSASSGAPGEFRDMTRLYLQSRFGSARSGKKSRFMMSRACP